MRKTKNLGDMTNEEVGIIGDILGFGHYNVLSRNTEKDEIVIQYAVGLDLRINQTSIMTKPSSNNNGYLGVKQSVPIIQELQRMGYIDIPKAYSESTNS